VTHKIGGIGGGKKYTKSAEVSKGGGASLVDAAGGEGRSPKEEGEPKSEEVPADNVRDQESEQGHKLQGGRVL